MAQAETDQGKCTGTGLSDPTTRADDTGRRHRPTTQATHAGIANSNRDWFYLQLFLSY
ncbi:hypothetical protein DESC_880024 [Desulfosarcina cetonica]|nr:hypothetical protein DESC_880024 [Desulfosarcina cetonica]